MLSRPAARPPSIVEDMEPFGPELLKAGADSTLAHRADTPCADGGRGLEQSGGRAQDAKSDQCPAQKGPRSRGVQQHDPDEN